MITANDALALLQQIGHADIDIDNQALMSDGILSSIAIMLLIGAIEEQYNCHIDEDMLDMDCFESCQAIADLVNKATALA